MSYDHATYLRHPDTQRVLQLFAPCATHEFVALLKLCGYLPASAEDYRAQQEQQAQRHEREGDVSDTRTSRYQRTCKVCGAPRLEACDKALCETHYVEYRREQNRKTHRNKRTAVQP